MSSSLCQTRSFSYISFAMDLPESAHIFINSSPV